MIEERDFSIADENGKHVGTMQTFEMKRILDYAKKWMEISNKIHPDAEQAIRIIEHSIKKCREVER